MIAAPMRNRTRAAESAFLSSSKLESQPPTSKAATVGIDAKTFHAALICPVIACCWPMVDASPFWALATNRNEVVSAMTATSNNE